VRQPCQVPQGWITDETVIVPAGRKEIPRGTFRSILSSRVSTRSPSTAFDAVGDPEAQAKVLIDPKSSAILPTAGQKGV
jgi:hypothetical protein